MKLRTVPIDTISNIPVAVFRDSVKQARVIAALASTVQKHFDYCGKQFPVVLAGPNRPGGLQRRDKV